MTERAVTFSVAVAKLGFRSGFCFSMKPGENNSSKANADAHELWGELIAIDNSTGQERTFTLYKSSGTILIVSDTGWERMAGPDEGLSKSRIFQEVMSQFHVHGIRLKPPFDPLPGSADASGALL
jgi:hypothetical protein